MDFADFSIDVCFPVLIYRYNLLFLLNYLDFGEILGKGHFAPRNGIEATNPGDLYTELSTDSVSNPRASHTAIEAAAEAADKAADEATGRTVKRSIRLRPISRSAAPNRPRHPHVG